ASQRQVWSKTTDFRADEPTTTELIYFPVTRSAVHPAWFLVLPEIGIGNTYEMIVDATDGTVLRRCNRLHFSNEPITFRVYTNDSPEPLSPGRPTPDGYQAPFVARTLVTVNPVDINAYSPNGWIDDGTNETRGNNVDAHLDVNADNNPDLPRPAGSPY